MLTFTIILCFICMGVFMGMMCKQAGESFWRGYLIGTLMLGAMAVGSGLAYLLYAACMYLRLP